MTEPTTDDLMRWALAQAGMFEAENDTTHEVLTECADEIDRLLALVAAQAEQIADLRAWAEHWERVMVVVTDQAAEYVTTFARVRALCDKADAGDGNDEMVHRLWTVDIRAALDGTEDPA